MILDRISALADSVSVAAAAQAPSRELVGRLVQGVQYSKWLILTYQAVLVSVVAFFSAWHAYLKIYSHRTRKHEGIQDPSTTEAQVDRDGASGSWSSSSGSSTLEGNATPPTGHEPSEFGESTPLLSTTHGPRRSWLSTVHLRGRAILMYQPRPIPIVNKALPENLTSVLILLLLCLNVFYAVFKIEWQLNLMFVFSDRTGLLFAANLPWLYLLGAKNQPLRLLTGYSYEHLNILHRRLGEWMCFLAVLHTAGMFTVWYTFFRPTGRTLAWFLTEKTVVLGLITFACYELLYATSLASFREWWYELFLGMHVVLQAGALGFLYFHHPGSRTYVSVALAIFLADRLVFRLALKSRSFKASLTVMEDGDTVMVSADWPSISRWQNIRTVLFGNNMHYGWQPTEHVFLTVPALARKHVIQAHPFTIASAAPENDHTHIWFNLVIRALDGFTRDLLNHAKKTSSVTVRLDGPYGSSHALDLLRSSDTAIVVAGGSGIAVAYPMLWSLLQAGARDVERTKAKQQVHLIWIVNQASHLDWIGVERLEELKELGLRVVLPPPTVKAGRPDVGALVRDAITSANDDAAVRRTGVVVSGPDSMNRAARNGCARLAWEGRDVKVSVEKFGW